MPIRDAAPLGAPCWIELFSSDTHAAETFSGELFGWSAEHAGDEYGGYINFSKDSAPVAGCMKNDGSAGMPDAWFTYLATGDIDAVAATATANGGQVHVAPIAVMQLGSMAQISDPGGAAIGAR